MTLRQITEGKIRGKGIEQVWNDENGWTETVHERSRWKVEGDGDPHNRSIRQNQVNRTIKISQTFSPNKSKLIRFLRQFISRIRYLTMSELNHHTDDLKCPPLTAGRGLGLGDPIKSSDSVEFWTWSRSWEYHLVEEHHLNVCCTWSVQ